MNDQSPSPDVQQRVASDAPQIGATSPRTSLKLAAEKTTRVGRLTDKYSEWFSSILVKETRQALKSRQFLWTFFLLLGVSGIWTMIGLTLSGEDVEGGRAGPVLFFGFCMILAFPLGVIIPFGAYRSLAHEFEDGTIQLISITTMKPYQIIAGKFGSAVLQMLVYLSVLAPCISFTYLLRGINLLQIGMAMVFCIVGSLSLSVLGLFLAGIARSRMFNVGISVVFVIFLFWLYTLWYWMLEEVVYTAPPNIPDEAIHMVYGFGAIVVSTAALLYSAAAAQISFPADNRSTLIRVMMLVQQTLFFSWFLLLASWMLSKEIMMVFGFVFGHYWLAMGALMIGESPNISRRVRRSLPRTTLSQSLFSLFMPGPGRGYLFALSNLFACTISMMVFGVFHQQLALASSRSAMRGLPQMWNAAAAQDAYWSLAVNALYVSFFLSCVYWLVRLVGKRVPYGQGPVVGALLTTVLVVGLTLTGLLLQFNFLAGPNTDDWSSLQIFNWYWTAVEVNQNGWITVNPMLFFVFACGVALVTLLSFTLASKELLYGRLATPERVLAEEEQKRQIEVPKGETIDEIFAQEPKSD